MQRQQISRTLSSSNESLSRVLIHSTEQTSEHTLPLSIIPSSSSVVTTTRRATHTQTVQETPLSFPSKSIPSFAETQLLSVYYPSKNPKNPSTNDKCIFVEQQDRQPIRYRTTYDPSSSTKSTQTSPSSTPLSTQGSTLIIDRNQENNPNYNQYLKIHSGSQQLSTNFNDNSSLSNELIEQSRYSYEEYIMNTRTSSSSSSSVTTVIAQNEERDSDHTSHLTLDTQSSTSSSSTNQEIPIVVNNQRISSWPPVPDDIDNQHENGEQRRPSRVQFAEQLVNIIPVSITNSLNEESISPPPVMPRTNINDSYHPVNQSKWVKTHLDNSDIQTNSTSNRVDALRSIFEQQKSTLNNQINQTQQKESEEKPSKHNVEIRFRVNDPPISTIHHAEPAKVIQQSTSPFNLDQIRQIIGKPLKTLDEIGYYLKDGHTWQWNEIFWLSLTTLQRDQLKELEHKLYSPSSNETKRYKTTINITGASSWQPHKSQTSTSGITKYTEINTIDETQSSISTFGSSPEPLSSSKRTDNQIPIIESGYNSSDDQQKYRPNSDPIIEESLNSIDPLSYEQFIIDYLSTYSKHSRSNNGNLILFIDEQKIHMSNISLPSTNENITLAKNIYLDSINYNLSPFETELEQLVIFISGETITLPSDRWLYYQKKYKNSKWINELKKINRNIPIQLIPFIEQWLSDHAILELNTHEINVDDLKIPLIGRLGEHIIDLHNTQKIDMNYWKEILKYLIHIGYVSYDSTERIIHIANSELILKSPSKELIERLTKYLNLLKKIHFHNENGTLIITDDFIIPNKYVKNLFLKYQQGEDLNINQLADLLLQICEIEEDTDNQSLILKFDNQILKILNENHIQFLTQWLEQLNQQKLINITEENNIIIYPNNNEQQIFIKHEHVDTYMKTKSNSIINMNDIANILLLYDYVQYSSGQLIYKKQNIQLDTNEFLWLISIIHSIRTIEHTQQTEIELSDGQHTQRIQIPYEYMPPTNNKRIVADYLFQNGNVRYDTNTRHYAYNYVSRDEKTHSIKRTSEHELLLSHIRHVHIDKNNQKIELEFLHDPNNYLELPSNWYQEILKHNFDYSYIIDMLLNNGGIITEDNFMFNNHSYSFKFSSKQKEDLIDYYVEFINNHDGIKYDNTTNLLLLENPLDGSELYLTQEHTQFIHENQYRRRDMKYLLNKYSQIKQDEFNNWLLYYNNQCIQIPTIDKTNEQVHIHHRTVDPNLKLLFPFNKSLRLIQKTPSTTTLDIQQPTAENNYIIDPLLVLANYIHRAGTLYQDELGRLVIKLYQHEIVVPRIQAINSIESINTSPNRAGTIIARLIDGLGKVQSNKSGGIIITIGNKSFELSKETVDQSKNNFNLSTENLTLSTSPILHSKSSDSLSSSSRSQTSSCLKPCLIIIHDNETTRFYIQHTHEHDRKPNSVMMLPTRYPIRPTQPQLITPQHYQDIALREASVYVHKQGENRVYYENLAQYLSTKQTDLSSRIVRRMLKFSSRDEYFNYLNKQMPANNAEQLVQESEGSFNETSTRFTNIRINTPDKEISPSAFYNVQNGTMISEQEQYNQFIDRSPSSSSRSPQTTNGQSLITPEKNVPVPRNTNLSGHSNDGESEGRTAVSRSASAAAKVATSKSDTMKSTTSSSGPSSREHPDISTVVRTQSLVSPNRTSGSKGGGDETKKEKKSKFRTPSFLRKRKEKKEAAHKEKAEK